jgi:hypothetical protein
MQKQPGSSDNGHQTGKQKNKEENKEISGKKKIDPHHDGRE